MKRSSCKKSSLLKYLPESRGTAIQLVFSYERCPRFFLPKFLRTIASSVDIKLPNGEAFLYRRPFLLSLQKS